MSKQRRQKILELIKEKPIETQADLLEALQDSGFEVTQSTISRDIKQLHMIKVLDQTGRYRYSTGFHEDFKVSPESARRYEDMFSKSVIGIQYAMNDVVIKCYAGMAQGACVAVDALFSDMVVGTLAGDDTIFAITKSEEEAELLVQKLSDLI